MYLRLLKQQHTWIHIISVTVVWNCYKIRSLNCFTSQSKYPNRSVRIPTMCNSWSDCFVPFQYIGIISVQISLTWSESKSSPVTASIISLRLITASLEALSYLHEMRWISGECATVIFLRRLGNSNVWKGSREGGSRCQGVSLEHWSTCFLLRIRWCASMNTQRSSSRSVGNFTEITNTSLSHTEQNCSHKSIHPYVIRLCFILNLCGIV